MPQDNDITFESEKRATKPRILFYIFSTIIIIFLALLLLTVIITRQVGAPIMVLNHSLIIMGPDSMGKTIPPNSLVVIRKVDTDILLVGDIITVKEENGGDGNLLTTTHRITSINPESDGLTFITKGDKNTNEDPRVRLTSDVYGKVVMVSPEIGQFLVFVKSPLGLLICIALPLALLLIIEIVNLLRVPKKVELSEYRIETPLSQADRFGTRSFETNDKKHTKKARNDVAVSTDFLEEKLSRKEKKAQSKSKLRNMNYDFDQTIDAPEPISRPIEVMSQKDELFSPYAPAPMSRPIEPSSPTPPAPMSRPIEVYSPAPSPSASRPIEVIRHPPSDTLLSRPIEVIHRDSPSRITTIDEDDDYREALEFRSPRVFKIEPLNPTRVRITPQTITTAGDDELLKPVLKIQTLQEEMDAEAAQILENLGEFSFDRPNELMFGISNTVQIKHPFSLGKSKLALKRDDEGEFVATVQNMGRDHFTIDGIDVKIKSNTLKLEMQEESDRHDINVIVTDEYTNVIVKSNEFELSFAMFKDVSDNMQKVVVQKKNTPVVV